jgi:hypothetical protein
MSTQGITPRLADRIVSYHLRPMRGARLPQRWRVLSAIVAMQALVFAFGPATTWGWGGYGRWGHDGGRVIRGPRGPQGLGGPQGAQGPRGEPGAAASDGSEIALWITAGAAVIALIVAGLTIVDNRRVARHRVTHEVVARLEAPELIESKAVMSSFLRGGLQPPSIPDATWATMNEDARLAAAPLMWEHLYGSSDLDDRRTVVQIMAFPNMLEEVAGMYNDGLLDQKIVKTAVEAEADNFWGRASWWLALIRSPENNVFDDLKLMIEKLDKVKRPRPLQS